MYYTIVYYTIVYYTIVYLCRFNRIFRPSYFSANTQRWQKTGADEKSETDKNQIQQQQEEERFQIGLWRLKQGLSFHRRRRAK